MHFLKKNSLENSLAVQELGLCTFTAEGPSSIPSQGTKIVPVVPGKKKIPIQEGYKGVVPRPDWPSQNCKVHLEVVANMYRLGDFIYMFRVVVSLVKAGPLAELGYISGR